MNQTEFMDLLRYYFRRVSEAELQEILSDYESHFKEGKARGLSEEAPPERSPARRDASPAPPLAKPRPRGSGPARTCPARSARRPASS